MDIDLNIEIKKKHVVCPAYKILINEKNGDFLISCNNISKEYESIILKSIKHKTVNFHLGGNLFSLETEKFIFNFNIMEKIELFLKEFKLKDIAILMNFRIFEIYYLTGLEYFFNLDKSKLCKKY